MSPLCLRFAQPRTYKGRPRRLATSSVPLSSSGWPVASGFGPAWLGLARVFFARTTQIPYPFPAHPARESARTSRIPAPGFLPFPFWPNSALSPPSTALRRYVTSSLRRFFVPTQSPVLRPRASRSLPRRAGTPMPVFVSPFDFRLSTLVPVFPPSLRRSVAFLLSFAFRLSTLVPVFPSLCRSRSSRPITNHQPQITL